MKLSEQEILQTLADFEKAFTAKNERIRQLKNEAEEWKRKYEELLAAQQNQSVEEDAEEEVEEEITNAESSITGIPAGKEKYLASLLDVIYNNAIVSEDDIKVRDLEKAADLMNLPVYDKRIFLSYLQSLSVDGIPVFRKDEYGNTFASFTKEGVLEYIHSISY